MLVFFLSVSLDILGPAAPVLRPEVPPPPAVCQRLIQPTGCPIKRLVSLDSDLGFGVAMEWHGVEGVGSLIIDCVISMALLRFWDVDWVGISFAIKFLWPLCAFRGKLASRSLLFDWFIYNN